MSKITAERARELLTYDRETGVFAWRNEARAGVRRSVVCHRAGDRAGTRRKDGRNVIRLDGALYLGYRVAWLMETGGWPDGEIDHIDGDPANDSISNLRVVSRRLNQQNIRRAQANKASCDYLGVYANQRNTKSPWRACITLDGKHRQIGVYKTPEEAHAAYVKAKRLMHEGCTL